MRPGFLKEHRNGPAGRTVWVPWTPGFLRLQYDDEGLIEQAGWVRKDRQAVRGDQLQLWFMWVNGMVTFKTERGLSGTCWSSGYVSFGTVWDDDGDRGPGQKTDLETWVDACIAKMTAD
jgi:hypothetical protein